MYRLTIRLYRSGLYPKAKGTLYAVRSTKNFGGASGLFNIDPHIPEIRVSGNVHVKTRDRNVSYNVFRVCTPFTKYQHKALAVSSIGLLSVRFCSTG